MHSPDTGEIWYVHSCWDDLWLQNDIIRISLGRHFELNGLWIGTYLIWVDMVILAQCPVSDMLN